jgi:alpha-beta hydrolase superfamily lysophospholipase
MLRENSAGLQPIGAPILVAQGGKDTLVEPSATEGFVDRTCGAGRAQIDFRLYPDATHGTIASSAKEKPSISVSTVDAA